MRIRIVDDEDGVRGEFTTLCPFAEPPPVVVYENRPHVLAPELCKEGDLPVYREPSWSLVEPIGWGHG